MGVTESAPDPHLAVIVAAATAPVVQQCRALRAALAAIEQTEPERSTP